MDGLTPLGWLWTVWGALGCAFLILRYGRLTWASRRLTLLRDVARPEPPEWPKLSVVIAACNEVTTLEAALATLCAEDYPALEIVVVDDRSDDGTGALLDRLAAADPRITAVHVTRLPDGWLGKVHALSAGVARAGGQFILFTDADVHFHRGALRRAVAWMLADGLEHLTVLPDARALSWLEEVVIDAMGGVYLEKTRADLVGRPRSRAYAGVGAFNLVRASALARSEGLGWLRMEVLDDVGLGLVLQRAGARARFAIGTGTVELIWYPSLRAMAGGLEKNLFGWLARYRVADLAALLLREALVLTAPIAAFLAPGWLWIGGALATVMLIASALAEARRTGRRARPMLVQPLGQLVILAMLIGSALACVRRRGIVWRGTAYPLAALRAGQRVR